jgi:glycosyltransferase involved in cell wall biosynthesis
MKKIGVVIPVYNGEKTIKKSIKSLKNQTFKDWLAIIINDGSTDKTKEILDAESNDNRFHIVHFDQNMGRPYARQKGLEIVRELELKYMCMLDADDWYYPNKLKYQFQFMERNSEIALLSSAIGVTNAKSNLFKVIKPFLNYEVFQFTNFKKFVELPHASSIIRVEYIPEKLKYDISLKFSEDQDFLRRFLINRKYVFDPYIQYIYNRDDSFSLKKYKRSMLCNYLSYKKLQMGLMDNMIYFLKNRLKYHVVQILFFFKLEDIYKSKIGVSPSDEEFSEFSRFKSI